MSAPMAGAMPDRTGEGRQVGGRCDGEHGRDQDAGASLVLVEDSPGERRGAVGGRSLRHRTEASARTADVPPLTLRDVEVGQGRQLFGSLDAFGADAGADAGGEADDSIGEGGQRRLSVDAADQRAVELEDVGAQRHDALQAGVALTDVIDRDSGAAFAQLVENTTQDNRIGDLLVLGDLDLDAGQVPGKPVHEAKVAQARGAEVDRERRARRSGAGEGQSPVQGHELECQTLPRGVGSGEDLVDGYAVEVRKS